MGSQSQEMASSALDVASAAGIYDGVPIRSYGAYPHDFNRDGLEDVMLVPHVTRPGRLYRNDGGRFTQVEVSTFTKRDRHGCAWADVNQDGFPDMYCTIAAGGGTGVKANELWIQGPAGAFTNKVESYGVADPYGRGREAAFIDVNHDAYPDLYVSNEYPRKDGIPSPNRLFINEGGRTFRSAAEYGLDVEVGIISGYVGTCVQAIDFDGDGWEDLLVCGKRGVRLYQNEQGVRFKDVSASVGLGGIWRDGELLDLNRDGRLDALSLTSTALRVQLGTSGSTFGSPTTIRAISFPQKFATGDVNRDAAVDVYVVRQASSTGNEPDLMLLNAGDGRNFTNTVIPQTTVGDGQSVAGIDHDSNGTTDFIVLNGRRRTQGPIQLISFP